MCPGIKTMPIKEIWVTDRITCFLPLEEHLRDKPNLEFQLNPSQEVVEHVERPDVKINKFDLPEGCQPDAENCFTYDLVLGDVAIFGKLVLHRTCYPTGEFSPRTSMEFRLTTRDSLIDGKDYFDLRAKKFYLKE